MPFVWQLVVNGYQPVYSCVFSLILIMLLTLCKGNVCAAQLYSNANWPANTLSNTVASGTCVAGYTGTPSRECLASGQWSTTVSNACTRALRPTSFDRACMLTTGLCRDRVPGKHCRQRKLASERWWRSQCRWNVRVWLHGSDHA